MKPKKQPPSPLKPTADQIELAPEAERIARIKALAEKVRVADKPLWRGRDGIYCRTSVT